MRRRYRSHVGILLDILRTISEEEATVTKIIMNANLPYERLKPFLQKLLNEGYIEEVVESERKYYRITEQGLRLLNELKIIKRVFEKLGLPL